MSHLMYPRGTYFRTTKNVIFEAEMFVNVIVNNDSISGLDSIVRDMMVPLSLLLSALASLRVCLSVCPSVCPLNLQVSEPLYKMIEVTFLHGSQMVELQYGPASNDFPTSNDSISYELGSE